MPCTIQVCTNSCRLAFCWKWTQRSVLLLLLLLLYRVVRSAGFLTGGILDCNLAHRRSAAELCMLFKIKSNPMHPLSGALPLPYVSAACVTRGALVAHRHSFAPPRCRTSQYRRTFVPPLGVSLERSYWPCVWWCGTGGFQEQSKCIPVDMIWSSYFISYYFIFFFRTWVGCVALGSLEW